MFQGICRGVVATRSIKIARSSTRLAKSTNQQQQTRSFASFPHRKLQFLERELQLFLFKIEF